MSEKSASGKLEKVIRRTVAGFFGGEITREAAAMTYYLIFAIFPFLIVIGSFLGALHLPMLAVEDGLARLLPLDVVRFLNATISHMNAASNGAVLTFGLIFTFWFPLRAVKHMMISVNRIYGFERPEKRPFRVLALTLIVVVFIPLQVMVLIVGEGALELMHYFVPMTEGFVVFWPKLRFLPVAAGVFFLVCAVYTLSVNERLKRRYVIPGALISTAIWLLFSVLFSYYVDNMGRYSVIYGSIGAIIAFLVWVNISVTAFLIGALVNQSLRMNESE